MISKDNIKYCIFVAFISIVLFKAINSTHEFILGINSIISFFSPFLLSILICLLINPLVMFLEKKFKLPRILNIFISFVIVFIFLGFTLNLLIPSLVDTLNTIIIEIPNSINNMDLFLNRYLSKIDVFDSIMPLLQKNLNSILNNIVNTLNNLSSDIVVYLISITSLFFNLLMGFILSIYILYDKEHIILNLKNLLYSIFSKKRSLSVIEFFNISNEIFYHYIIGQLISSIVIGIIAFIGFEFIINIKSSLFLSFIIFITNMIPYLGPFIGAVLPILMTFVYSPIKSLWVAIFIFILQQIEGNILGPKIMGDCVGLSPLWIICALLIGGSLFGFVGVFLSVPIAAIIKVYIDKYIDKNINIEDSE